MVELEQIKVSVIMPVYNAETFLREALDTVINQTLREIEIICVDDGSEDASLNILMEYEKLDKRIRVLKQENRYAGAARNYGLKNAHGKYVVFWDSDDLFELFALEKLYKKSEQDKADICICSARQLDNETGGLIDRDVYLVNRWRPKNTPFSKKDAAERIFNFAANVPWNKMFLREFVQKNQLEFQEIKQANDTYFILISIFLAERITYVNERLITYRINNNMSLTGKASETVFCAYESYLATLEALLQYEEFQNDEVVKRSFMNRSMGGFFHSLYSQKDFEAFKKLYEMLVSEGFAKFGIIGVNSGDGFYTKWHYDDLQKMLTLSPEQFLLWKVDESRWELIVKNVAIGKLKREQAKLKSHCDELKTKNNESETKYNTIKTENSKIKIEQSKTKSDYSELKAKNDELVKQLEKLRNEKNRLRNSLSVRMALKLRKIITLNGKIKFNKRK